MSDDYEPFDVPEFSMSYEEEADLDGECDVARSGQLCESETVNSIWRGYIMDPLAWDFAPAKARIEELIAGRSAAKALARVTNAARVKMYQQAAKARRTEAQKAWNGGMYQHGKHGTNVETKATQTL